MPRQRLAPGVCDHEQTRERLRHGNDTRRLPLEKAARLHERRGREMNGTAEVRTRRGRPGTEEGLVQLDERAEQRAEASVALLEIRVSNPATSRGLHTGRDRLLAIADVARGYSAVRSRARQKIVFLAQATASAEDSTSAARWTLRRGNSATKWR